MYIFNRIVLQIGTEAHLHQTHEYYTSLSRVTKLLTKCNVTLDSRVLLATDDPSVIQEMQSQYKVSSLLKLCFGGK